MKTESRPAISAIAVEGFKSLGKASRIEVRPLTILAGANSSGKSSVIQPLLLMKQTLEAPFDPGALRPDGPHVQFTAAEQLLTRFPSSGKVAEEFRVRIESSFPNCLELDFRSDPEGLFDVARMTFNQPGRTFELLPGMSGKLLQALQDLSPVFQLLHSSLEQGHVVWEVQRSRCFLTVVVTLAGRREEVRELIPNTFFSELLLAILHVPGLRGNPERSYRVAAVGDRFPGPFHSYAASVIALWQRQGDDRLRLLNRALAELGLTNSIVARPLDATQAELLVGRRGPGSANGEADLVSLADVGFGVSQVVPVLVALLIARQGQLVYLEQPELHLHPRAQQALAGILASAAERGVRVVVETHSDTLLLAIQSLVAEGALAPEKVKLHWFSRNRQGATKIASADLDAYGAYGDWPEDFGAVDAEVQNRYLTAVEARARVGGRKRGQEK